MGKEKFYSVESFMTSIIDKANEIDKDNPLRQYIRERIEVCNGLAQMGLTERILIEIKFILINLEKQLNI